MKLLPQRGGGGSNGSNWEELNKMVFSSSQEPEMEMMQYLYYNIIVICRVTFYNYIWMCLRAQPAELSIWINCKNYNKNRFWRTSKGDVNANNTNHHCIHYIQTCTNEKGLGSEPCGSNVLNTCYYTTKPWMGCNCMKYTFANNAVTFGMNQYCNMQMQAFTDENLMV
jgi:hypothetical protein